MKQSIGFANNFYLSQQEQFVKKAFFKAHFYAGLAFLLSFVIALGISFYINKNLIANPTISFRLLISSAISLLVGFIFAFFAMWLIRPTSSKTTMTINFSIIWLLLTYGLAGILTSGSLYVDGFNFTEVLSALVIVSGVYITAAISGYYMSNKTAFNLRKFLFIISIVSLIMIVIMQFVYIFAFNKQQFNIWFLVINIVGLIISVISLILTSQQTRAVLQQLELSDNNKQLTSNFILYTAFVLFYNLFTLLIYVIRLMRYLR
ncbi:hypothetical protein [Mycoplasma sp. E35C]|uniref:hypothetical protein n=1 Tax=Mycoplasma sp. E35C TaxID=2801918 RepID=UPI001CA3CFA8|nr:hypothetical protein [Mycoplasma sp. E35C]QZX49302.1 hypothetical protein JJE79_00900 [Mycoplasma sp. E35C]